MRPDEPAWWYCEDATLAATALSPVAAAYGWIVQSRFRLAKPYRSRLPVLCIGNFTAGGTGKTPLALHLCEILSGLGQRPAILTRGYGGRIAGPHWVATDDTATNVGDEALLLAGVAPVVVARNRAAGARNIEASPQAADAIIMDDGLQNPQIAKDLSVAVVDGNRGVGNGLVMPAGPLRAPLSFQLELTDAIVVNSALRHATPRVADWLKAHFKGPVLRAVTIPVGDTSWLRNRRIVAWAGIGAPQRFFDLATTLGAECVERVTFRDHQALTLADARRLLALARRHQASLLSTEKDLARLKGTLGDLAEVASATRALPVRLEFSEQDAERLKGLVRTALRMPG